MKKLTLLLTVLLLSSCGGENSNESINGSINRLEREITVTVTTVDSDAELRRLYQELTGNSNPPDQYGFAQWNELANAGGIDVANPNCQIYILAPKRKDDNNILTLGHEMAHCIWGSYHR